MRKATRFYIIGDDGTIRRLAYLKFEGIITQRMQTPFADLAGKRVRYVQLTVQLEQRRAVAILRALFRYLTFDNDGMFDSSEWDQAFEATVDAWGSPVRSRASSSADAITHFANRRRAREYEWQPTVEMRRVLLEKVTRNRRPSTARSL